MMSLSDAQPFLLPLSYLSAIYGSLNTFFGKNIIFYSGHFKRKQSHGHVRSLSYMGKGRRKTCPFCTAENYVENFKPRTTFTVKIANVSCFVHFKWLYTSICQIFKVLVIV